MDFRDSAVLVTGGTGSFGRAVVRHLLDNSPPRRLVVFSRDEMKQWDMAGDFSGHENLRFLTGDVRDKERLRRAFDGIDYVIHAAASKIVPEGEYNPFETTKTNVLGAMNVIDSAIDSGVKKVVALSTDKASAPVNLYGATKLVSDKMFVAGNSYAGARETRFSVVRYGNVMGSRGSVIPYFLEQTRRGEPLPITDDRMTRFMITLQQGVELVLAAFDEMVGGEIFVKKIPSMSVLDIAEAINPGGQRTFVGIRPGEKIHEQMISPEDAITTFDFGAYFKILPTFQHWSSDRDPSQGGQPVGIDFSYSSDANSEWMSVDDLRAWISVNYSSKV